ncbi:protein shortage in chiasmata 1 ortholog-like [Lineus longissimus]|uniref:protein shortage in chiasmata 1 ortholog-like n=1 Tax=Lineus longissimus TaxID=88925 RepID=UPI00315D7E90
MPRFLGIDYLAEAVNHRRTALNRMLVTTPQHLECVDSYPHNGLLEDYMFRLPWKRAKCDANFDGHTTAENIFKELAWLKDQYPSDELQKCSDTSIMKDANFGTTEVVLSSNPDLPPPTKDDIWDDIAIGKQGQGLGDKETFYKEELEVYSAEEGKTPFLLEDIEEVDNLSEFMNHLPQLTDLMGRLRPKTVQDPFVDKEGSPISEQLIIRDHEFDLSETSTMAENPEVKEEHHPVKEIFDRDFLLDVLEEPIEEELNLFIKELPEANELTIKVLESLSPVNLEPIIIEDDEESEQVQEMNSLAEEHDKQQVKPPLETVDMSPNDLTNCADFAAMNSVGVDDDCQEKPLLLESPIDGHGILEVQVETIGVKDMVPFEESPITGHQYVLSPSSRDEIERKLWIAENYFSDVLTLARLPEPVEPRRRKEFNNVIADAKGMLSLRQDSGLADVELDLNWDPISASEQEMRTFSKTEMMTYSTLDCYELEEWKTLFEKYDRAYFIDWKDELIQCKMPVASHQTQNSDGMMRTVSRDTPCRAKEKSVSELEVSHQTSDSAKQTIAITKTLKLREKGANPVKADPSNLKRLRLLDNPLDNFLLMRGVGKSSEASVLSTRVPEPRTSMVEKLERTHVNVSTPPLTPTTPSRDPKKPKTKSIEVTLTDDFSTIIHAIHLHAEPHLTVLKLRNLIPASHRFDSLTSDVTRFMLKQHEKTMQDSQEEDQYDDTYSAVVVLHALVTATDYLIHCCLQSAIAILSAMQEKHKSVLGGLLSTLRQQLFKSQCRFQQGKVLHPKVAAMCSNITHWYKRKKQVSFDQDPKILVILRRDLSSLRECICEALSEVKDFQPFSIKELPTHQDVVDSLDHHNCIIVPCNQIGSDFQWSQFSLVVEYEQTDDLTLKELCQRQNIRYLSLKTVKGETLTTICPEKGLEKAAVSQHQFTFIGSEMVTANTELLHHLEAKCNITIIERMYSQVSTSTGHKFHHADLVVDERTCIVLQNVSNLVEVHQMEPLVEKIIALSLKYEKCWVIVFSATTEKEKTKYSFAGSVGGNLCKLYGTLSQVTSDQLSVQVNFVNSISGIAKMIRRIGDVSLKATSVWGKQDWVDRTWLTEQMSEHEKYLLALPWFNTLSAQILLTADTLSQLMMLSLSELIEKVPWLPEKVLKSFHNFSHRRSGISLSKYMYMPPVKCDILEDGRQVESVGNQAGPNGKTFGFEDNKQDIVIPDVQVEVECDETLGSKQSIAEVVCRSPLDFISNGYSARSNNYVPSKNGESDELSSKDRIMHDVPVQGLAIPQSVGINSETATCMTKQRDVENLMQQDDNEMEYNLREEMNYSDTISRTFTAPGQIECATRSKFRDSSSNLWEKVGSANSGRFDISLPKRPKLFTDFSDKRLLQSSAGSRTLAKSDTQGRVRSASDRGRSCVERSHLELCNEFDNGRWPKKSHPVKSGAYSAYSATSSEGCRSDVELHRSNADSAVEQSRAKQTVYQTSGRSVADMIEEVRQSREKTSLKENENPTVLLNKNHGSIPREREGLAQFPSKHKLSRTSPPSVYLGASDMSQVSQPKHAHQKSIEHSTTLGVHIPLPSKKAQPLRDVFSSKRRPAFCDSVGHSSKDNVNRGDPIKRVAFIKQEPIDVESPQPASDGRNAKQRDTSNQSHPAVLSHASRPGGLYPLSCTVDPANSYLQQPSYTSSSIQMPPVMNLHSGNSFEHYSNPQRDPSRGTEYGYSVDRLKPTATAGSSEINPSVRSSESYSSHKTNMPFMTAHYTSHSQHSITNPARKIPGVAPVTPTVRRPLQALGLAIGGSEETLQDRQGVSLNHSYDSPPMDLNSDEENCSDFYHPSPSITPGQRVVMTPQVWLRKRRLIYEKVPGAKDGQTRLTFI